MLNYAARFPFVSRASRDISHSPPLRLVRVPTSLEMTEGLGCDKIGASWILSACFQILREKHSLGQRRAGHSCRCRVSCYRRYPTIRSTSKTRSPPASDRKTSRRARISPTHRRRHLRLCRSQPNSAITIGLLGASFVRRGYASCILKRKLSVPSRVVGVSGPYALRRDPIAVVRRRHNNSRSDSISLPAHRTSSRARPIADYSAPSARIRSTMW